MSIDLEHDIRTAFDELAATTTISSTPRFGDVTAHPAHDPRRRSAVVLAAAAVVLALVGGLALLVRDRTAETPAPAATTVPLADPAFFLFPDASSDLRFGEPLAALDAYLADRVTTGPPGQTVTYTVSAENVATDRDTSRVILGFALTVNPDDPSLCCDSGDGVASLQQLDGAWFVTSAEITAMQVHTLSYADDGTVAGAFSPLIGGTYTVTVDDFGADGPEEDGVVAEHVPDPTDPTNGPTFRLPGFTAPAVAVRIWQSPGAGTAMPAAMFAEFIVPRGIENAANIADDPATPLVTAPPIAADAHPRMLSATSPTPEEAVEGYLIESTERTGELVDAGLLDDVPSASVAPTGRLYTFAVVPGAVRTRENEAWVRFELAGTGGTTEGIARVVDTGWVTGTPAWTVSEAGTRGVVLRSVQDRDALVSVDAVTSTYQVYARSLGTDAIATALTPVTDGIFEAEVLRSVPTWAVAVWSRSGTTPAFAEVLVNEGGEHPPVDFGERLDSLFDPDAQVTIPTFIGLTLGQAQDVAAQLGLSVEIESTPVPPGDPGDGTIVRQGLAPGTLSVRGAAFTITLAEADVP